MLVVDDEADARKLYRAMLSHYGAEVRSCTSAREALEHTPTWKPDVLLVDIQMPEFDGYYLIGELRSLPSEDGGSVPTVAITAFASERDPILRAGFDECLLQPLSLRRLAAVVSRLARER